ncbi:flagellar protein FlaG [Acetivibrio clariflavus]|uniref:Flagellar protein FlaG n=1 Tax=Acetivibrio clariflavus (strain DSM 19732 / NBRC 101661 / EBR45) TaxID=720554 RepID=G8LSZ7_ACECE|nr:flagellar protein FlaG [Acetivibrio clariflavus]AEV70510.1 flagellar protein FlaG [Acetivibrio clariflavus DSM 19732]
MNIKSMDAAMLQSVRTQNVDMLNIDRPRSDISSQNHIKDSKNTSSFNAQGYEKKDRVVSEEEVLEAIEKANKAIVGSKRQFEFSIHEKTKQIMVKVIDAETQEIIREIPPEKILDMVAKMWELAGILVDERR